MRGKIYNRTKKKEQRNGNKNLKKIRKEMKETDCENEFTFSIQKIKKRYVIKMVERRKNEGKNK